MHEEVKQSKFEALIKERFGKFRSNRRCIYFEEKKNIHPLFALLFLDADLIAGSSVLIKKPEYPKNFSTDRGKSNPNNVGTIIISLQLHWSNGYCTSLSSSNDG
jgi:hypothetical protein